MLSFGRVLTRQPFMAGVRRLATVAAAQGEAAASARLLFHDDEAKLVVPLPQKSSTIFSLRNNRPFGSLLLEVQEEDPSANEVVLLDEFGRRISKSTAVIDALRPGSKIIVNGKPFPIVLPTLEERLASKKADLAALEEKLTALNNIKDECDKYANKHANRLVWLGFAGLSAQWGLMMRLTWYDYSWDVMEPIAYFLTFGTGILGYFFYIVSRQDYTYEALSGLTTTLRQRKEYNKRGLDVHQIRAVSDAIAQMEADLERIKIEHKKINV